MKIPKIITFLHIKAWTKGLSFYNQLPAIDIIVFYDKVSWKCAPGCPVNLTND